MGQVCTLRFVKQNNAELKPKQGFGLVFCAWFDNLEIRHKGAIIAQETHYDPWGLELVGIGRQGLNRFTFNGQSEKQANLADGKGYFYETDFRSYDATLGRFHAYDLMASEYDAITPYHFALNNPISANDPTGLEAESGGNSGEIKKKSANNSERPGPKPVPQPIVPKPILPVTPPVIKPVDIKPLVATPASTNNNAQSNNYVCPSCGQEVPVGHICNPSDNSKKPFGLQQTSKPSPALTPASKIDYSQAVNWDKFYEDTNYMAKGVSWYAAPIRFFEVLWRDLTAPNNRETVHDVLSGSGQASFRLNMAKKGGGKNSKHSNESAKKAALEKYTKVKEEYDILRTKSNKTPEEKEQVDKLKNQVDHWKSKADWTGEEHSKDGGKGY